MQCESWTWSHTRLPAPARVMRWGHYGIPVLLFPSAGGDFDEVERFHLVGAVAELIERGRIKVFSVDGIAPRTWLRGVDSPGHCAHIQAGHDEFINDEVVPLIRKDCHSDDIQILAAGSALGAHSAVSALCRNPENFRAAIALSGLFDLSQYLPAGYVPDLYWTSPLYYLPGLPEADARLHTLRNRFIQLATGAGEYERPGESHRLAHVLRSRGIPHHLDDWGNGFSHRWTTWRDMLPRFLAANL